MTVSINSQPPEQAVLNVQPDQTLREQQCKTQLPKTLGEIPGESCPLRPSVIHDSQNHEQNKTLFVSHTQFQSNLLCGNSNQNKGTVRKVIFSLILIHPDNSAPSTNQGHIFITHSSTKNVDYDTLTGSDFCIVLFCFSTNLSPLFIQALVPSLSLLSHNLIYCILNRVLLYYL